MHWVILMRSDHEILHKHDQLWTCFSLFPLGPQTSPSPSKVFVPNWSPFISTTEQSSSSPAPSYPCIHVCICSSKACLSIIDWCSSYCVRVLTFLLRQQSGKLNFVAALKQIGALQQMCSFYLDSWYSSKKRLVLMKCDCIIRIMQQCER